MKVKIVPTDNLRAIGQKLEGDEKYFLEYPIAMSWMRITLCVDVDAEQSMQQGRGTVKSL